jgi:integrase
VRAAKGPRIRIREELDTPEFMAAYLAAMGKVHVAPRPTEGKSGSLAWLVSRYQDSTSWASLAPGTRKQREIIFRQIIEAAGENPFVWITRQTIADARDRRKATPFAAKTFLKTMRGLFRWALEAGFVASDPAEGVKISTPRTDGIHCWTDEEIEKFEARWPIGTRERLALAILLYTGLRRGDAARLGRQHVRDGVIMLRTAKNSTPIEIPVLPELAEIIAASRTGDLAFIATQNGRPMTKESFGMWFRNACKTAGVPGSAHGLRKAGAVRAANSGATVAELEAIFGWTGGNMASLYTRGADRARLARQAINKLSRGEKGNAIPRTGRNPRART